MEHENILKTLRAAKARDAAKDKKFKYITKHRATKKCVLDGCDQPLTHYRGPGGANLCREHQIRLREYGGPGRTDRHYSFWKKDCCESCGRMPSRDNVRIAQMPQPMRDIIGRMMLQVDHKTVRRQGGDHPDNLITLCAECHQLKTYANADHLSK